jgi:flagellum-specific ATP synthase
VFALLAGLLERAGPHPAGTITGLYTVLVEGDDLDEPITDHSRSILDGHYVLSRRLATAGHFPSIDVPASTSRLVSKILDREQLAFVNHARSLLSALAEGRDLIELGAYVAGTNPTLDRALEVRDRLDALLRQDASSVTGWDEARHMLMEVLAS